MTKRKRSTKLNFIDVFSGAGGFSAGLELAGMKCLLGIDFDLHAINTFAHNHHHAQTYCGDVSKLNNKKLKTLLDGQEVHVVVGGPPCQGFSTVGLGDPKDQRNSLFLQFVRIVKVTQPYFLVIENVTGLLAKKNEPTLKAIFKQFEKLGYHMDVQVLSAQNYGVPEVRRRTILIGSRLPVQINFPKLTHEKNPITVGQALNDLHSSSGELLNHDLDHAKIKNKLDFERLKRIPEGKGIRYQADEKAYLTKRLSLNIDWDSTPERRLRQTKYQRLDRSRPSPTIMTHRQSYFHPTEHRYLTQREAARIQSFPNDFVFQGPVSAQWRQIGNAVPPLMAKAIGKGLLKMFKAYQAGEHLATPKRAKKEKIEEESKIITFRKKAFVYKAPSRSTPSKSRISAKRY